MSEKKKPMTVAEAGRMGGVKTRDSRGPEHYRAIGAKGGRAVRDKHGPELYKRIGKMGGARVRELLAAGKRLEAQEAKERGED